MTTPTHHTHTPYTDPVCGMSTDDDAVFQPYTHGGQTYYFCSEHCLAKFKAAPEQYIQGVEQKKHAHH